MTTRRWVKGTDGTKQLVETKRPIKPWWRTDVTGATVLTVRYGFKSIEFEKGKAGVAVPSKEKLASVIDTMIAAVRAGELDAMLGSARHWARGAEKQESGLKHWGGWSTAAPIAAYLIALCE